jgi:preprotein translocase subunit SecY
MTAHFFGGTSLLILVGVLLDTMRQMETFLLQQHYDGFLRKGKIRGRSTAAIGARSRAADDTTIIWLYAGIGAILILFAVILILK